MGRLINASSPGIIERPSIDESHSTGSEGEWIVTVYNNETNTWDEVMNILMLATNCDEEEAWIETWEVDNLGASVVHHADQDECVRVSRIIAQIGIRVEAPPQP